MKTKITLLLITWLLVTSTFAAKTPNDTKERKQSTAVMTGIMKSQFIENKGQIADLNGKAVNDVLFYVKRDNAVIYFKADRVIWVFQKTVFKQVDPKNIQKKNPIEKNIPQVESMEYQRVDMIFENTNENKIIESENAGKAKFNFYLSHCDKGALDVKTYSTIRYRNIYNNIDVEFRNDGDALKYNFILNPGADISNIKIKYDGADSINLNDASELEINSKLGKAVDKIPYSYILGSDGKKQNVNINWALNKNEVTYTSDKILDKNVRIIIDPSIVFVPFAGVASALYFTTGGDDIAADVDIKTSTGEFFIGGYTSSSNLPTGSYTIITNSFNSIWDGFISKFSASGTLIWGTYYGGNDADFITAIKCDQYSPNVGVYATGYSYSNSITTYDNSTPPNITSYTGPKQDVSPSQLFSIAPTQSSTGYNNTFRLSDAFLLHFSESGTIYFAKYFGSTASEFAYTIETDDWGYIYIGGAYENYDYPGIFTSTEPFILGTSSSKYGGFVACFNSVGILQSSRSVASSGSGLGANAVTDLVFEKSSMKLLVCGHGTLETALFSSSPLQSSTSITTGNVDIFVTKLNTTYPFLATPSIPVGTQFGGDYYDIWPRIAVYPNPNWYDTYNTDIYLAFTTNSDDMNTLGYTNSNSYKELFGGTGSVYNISDVFIAILNNSLSTLKYGSYLGGVGSPSIVTTSYTYDSYGDQLNDIVVDKYHNFYIYGITDEATFYFNYPGLSLQPGGNPEFPVYFLAKFNPDYSNNFIGGTQFANVRNISYPSYNWTDIATGGWFVKNEHSRIALNACNDQILLSGSSSVLHYPMGTMFYWSKMNAFADDVNVSPLFNLNQSGTFNYTGSPISFSIPSNPYITNIQWYLNGVAIPGATSLTYTTSVRGNYYVTCTDICSNSSFTSNTVSIITSCTDPSYIYQGPHIVSAPLESWTNQTINFTYIEVLNGAELDITNCILVASSCSYINIHPGGKLKINNSHLIGCDQWDGIILNNNSLSPGSPPHLEISNNSSIEDAIVGIYATINNVVGNFNEISVDRCTFKNNCTHVFVNNDETTINKTFTNNHFLNLSYVSPNNLCTYLGISYDPVGAYYSYVTLPPYNNQVMLSNVSKISFLSNFFEHTDNIQYNGIVSTIIDNGDLNQNKFTGFYNRGISIDNGIGPTVLQLLNVNQNILNGSFQYGIYLKNMKLLNVSDNTLNGTSSSLPVCIDNIGLYMKNCENTHCDRNIISQFSKKGIEYYIDHPTMSVSEISFNVIYPTSEGLVVSYDEDPMNNNPLSNVSTNLIQLQIKCNGFHQCEYGIVGSGYLIDQIDNGTPEDAGNVFHSSLIWDILWENSSTPYFTYYTYYLFPPNYSSLCLRTPTFLNNNLVTFSQFNADYWAATFPAPCRIFMKTTPESQNPFSKVEYTNIKIYPNPINNSFTITMNKVIADKVEIFDVLGRVVYSRSIFAENQNIEINISNWNTGIYFVKVYNNDIVVKSERILKVN